MKTFIENFTEQFEETPAEAFTPETQFKDLDEWDSMTALTIIAMVDEVYKVKLTGNDIRTANTIADLYELIKQK